MSHAKEKRATHCIYVVVKFYPWFKFLFSFCFGVWERMIVSFKQKKVKFKHSNNPISLEGLSVLASSLECIKPRKLDELKLTTANILGSKPHRVLSNLQCVVHTLIVEHLDKATLFADFLSQM